MRTFSQIRDEVMAMMDEVGEVNLTKTNVDNAINRAHEMRLGMHPWHFMLWPREETFTTVANQLEYSLHSQYAKPLWFWNQTLGTPLREVPFRQIPMMGLNYTQGQPGSACEFSMVGRSPVLRQPPSTGSVITVTAADDGAIVGVQIQGETTLGFTSETVTIPANATVGVTTSVFTTITRVSKTTAWAVGMTLTDSTNATLLALNPSEYGRTYPQLMLYALPQTGEVVKYRFYRTPTVLVNDYDITDLPHPHDAILTYDTLLLMTGYNAKVSPVAIQEWTRMRMELERQLYDFDSEHALHGIPQSIIVDPYGA
jgi:hypothetical protein